jgi:homoserine kinase
VNEQATIDQVACPLCKAEKTQPCTYVPFKVLPLYARSPQTRKRLARVGQPTKRPHNDRMDAFRKLERDRFWAAVRNERLEELAEAKEVHDARMAYGSAVRQETAQLVAWLRQFAPVLYGKP